MIFQNNLMNCYRFFKGIFLLITLISGIIPIPNDGDHSLIPDMYMLGSSTGGVEFAINEGLGFAFASHLSTTFSDSSITWISK